MDARRNTSVLAAAVLRLGGCLLCFPLASFGTDWPQYRGANHDATSTDRINRNWSGAVTNPVWLVSLTNCIGSVAVSGGRAFTGTRRQIAGADKECCAALSITNGMELWATAVDDAYYPNGGVGYDDGPRTTPTVNGGSVYVLSSYLKLYRLNATNGAVIWQRDLTNDYGGTVIPWQNAASPVLDAGLIYLNANCATSSLMALHSSDGSLAWRSQDEAMTHSTPLVATIHGTHQVIFATQTGLVALDAASGNRLWKFPYPFTYAITLGCSPVAYEDLVFVCGAHVYGMGSLVVQATLTNSVWTATQLWFTNNPASHWMTPVAYQGYLYGQFGIQQFDSVNAQLKCIDMRSGTVMWSADGFGRGGTIVADGHLLITTEQGELVLAAADPSAYVELARCLAIPNYSDFTNKCWNNLAAADGRIYVRSTAYAAAFDFSVPDLLLEAPRAAGAGQLQLTIRTATGAPLDSNRLAGLSIRASPDFAQAFSQWTPLTNPLVLADGIVHINNVDSAALPRRFFIVSEPR
jgi:outer membrane protein assembly factor BamB